MAVRSLRGAFWGRPAFRAGYDVSAIWERRYARVMVLLPYILLGASTVISQIQPYRTAGDRLARHEQRGRTGRTVVVHVDDRDAAQTERM